MFGLLIPSRPLLPSPTQTHSPTQCSFTIPAHPYFSHLAIFIHPGQTLPPDTLAAIYIQLPSSQEFKLLGALGTDKQSAMYRVNTGKGQRQANSIEGIPNVREEVMVDDATEQPVANGTTQEVTVGISVEPAAQVQTQLEALEVQDRQQHPQVVNGSGEKTQEVMPSGDLVTNLAQRIGRNAFNFLAGFTEMGSGGREVVPIKAFEDWWAKFEKKVQLDPAFLIRDSNG